MVREPGATVDRDVVVAAVARRVPAYMVPAAVVVLDDLPLTANGKLDRAALPVVELTGGSGAHAAPQNPAETLVAQVFAELLDVDRVSVTDSFFDLGGNSLSAMRLAARASDALGVTVSVRDVFTAPSVRELVAAVSGTAPRCRRSCRPSPGPNGSRCPVRRPGCGSSTGSIRSPARTTSRWVCGCVDRSTP